MNQKEAVLKYLKNGMSASPGQVYDLIPTETQDKIFVRSIRSRRTASVCGVIYTLISEGKISEINGRYYKTKVVEALV